MTRTPPFKKKEVVQVTLDDVLREKYKRSLYAFAVDFWPIVEPGEPLVETQLMKVLAQHGQKFIEAMVADLRGEPWAKGYFQDLGVEVPPGSMKSLMFAVIMPAWAWGPYGCPWLRFIFSTYEHRLTLRDSTRRRELMQSPVYQRLFGHLVQFKKDTNEKTYYANERHGFCMSTSVGGSGTGHRAHCFVGDDLMNAIEAYSETAYNDVVTHLSAMSSRGVRQPVYRRLIIGQRLSEQDPGGWARSKGFEVLSLPTEFDPDTPAQTRIFKDWRTKRGELLNPVRMDHESLEKARLELGPYGYPAQHNQRVVPIDGGVIKLGWFVERPALPRSGYGALLNFWDTAYTQKAQNDQSARVVLGIRNDGKGVDVLHAEGHHLEMHALEKEVISDSNEWRPVVVAIENKASGISLIQNLRASTKFPFHIHEINIPAGFDKNARAHAATPFVARFLVGIDWSQPWAAALKAQLETFPAGKKRDIADAFVHAILYVQEHYRFGEQTAAIEAAAKAAAIPMLEHLSDKAPQKPSFNEKPREESPAKPEAQPYYDEDYGAPIGGDAGTW